MKTCNPGAHVVNILSETFQLITFVYQYCLLFVYEECNLN